MVLLNEKDQKKKKRHFISMEQLDEEHVITRLSKRL